MYKNYSSGKPNLVLILTLKCVNASFNFCNKYKPAGTAALLRNQI